MEKITTDEAAKMLEHLTGKRYVISASKKKEPMRVEYPARYMRKAELLRMENPLIGRDVLNRAIMYAPEGVARKVDPRKKNSPVIFDTEKFEEWRQRH